MILEAGFTKTYRLPKNFRKLRVLGRFRFHYILFRKFNSRGAQDKFANRCRKIKMEITSSGEEIAHNLVPDPDNYIYIVLDCLFYSAGERITGEVHLCFHEPIPESKIILKSKGIEEVKVKDSISKSKVFFLKSVLNELRVVEEQGEYAFPFTFKIPIF